MKLANLDFHLWDDEELPADFNLPDENSDLENRWDDLGITETQF